MPESTNESVLLGVHVGPDGTEYHVYCVAERIGTNESLVVFSRTKGDKAGQYQAEGVSAFLFELKQGNYKYRGPVLRVTRKRTGRTGRLFDKKV